MTRRDLMTATKIRNASRKRRKTSVALTGRTMIGATITIGMKLGVMTATEMTMMRRIEIATETTMTGMTLAGKTGVKTAEKTAARIGVKTGGTRWNPTNAMKGPIT